MPQTQAQAPRSTSGTPARHALIIGAGPGLGTALARRFGREGFALTLVARSEQKLAGIARDLRGEGFTVETLAADVADSARFRSALDTLAEHVTPSVVIYNAAVLAQDNILTSDTDYLLNAFTVDVLGAVSAAQVFTPLMRGAQGGTLLVTGGGLSLHPHPEYASLSIGKAALRAATSMLHDELKAEGVHVVGVTIAGSIEAGTVLDPAQIADTYWQLHAQPKGEWSAETVLAGE
jgi:short-subunit dehydrogenase